jgi:hypothetical protein
MSSRFATSYTRQQTATMPAPKGLFLSKTTPPHKSYQPHLQPRVSASAAYQLLIFCIVTVSIGSDELSSHYDYPWDNA